VCAGLPVEIRVQDYREVLERFDRIASVGMFEHVGPRHHRAFMGVVRRSLAEDGLCLLHFFATQRSWPSARDSESHWVERRIFPGMAVPSLAQVGRAMEGQLVLEDLHNFGADYDPTLMAWWANFDRAWPGLRERYGERFYRMWRYYLHLCAAAFRSRKYQVWQLVLSAGGVPGGYRQRQAPGSRAQPAVVSPVVTMTGGVRTA
jgi:cyclopropane-fatty-acyl-phospholipid synthase